MKITLPAPAKINLYLDVLGKRPDGYHNIKSVMQTVDLCDEITVEMLTPTPGLQSIQISCSESVRREKPRAPRRSRVLQRM